MRGGELDGVGKKSGIKLTVYSLQNAVCCLAVIFHEGLPCGAEWVRSPGEGATIEPFTEPLVPRASIHTSSFILEKKLGAPLQSAKVGGDRETFGVPKILHQVFLERIERLRRVLPESDFQFRKQFQEQLEIKIVPCHSLKAIAILILNT